MVNDFYIFVVMLLCCYDVFQTFPQKISLSRLLLNLGGTGDLQGDKSVKKFQMYQNVVAWDLIRIQYQAQKKSGITPAIPLLPPY